MTRGVHRPAGSRCTSWKRLGMADFPKVLRLTPHFYRSGIWPIAFDPVGGLQTQTWRLTEELAKSGISQTVLTSHIPGHPRRTRSTPFVQVDSVGVPLPQVAAFRLSNLAWFLGVAWRLIASRFEHDLIHIHYNHSVWCRALTMVAQRLDVPVVVTLSTELWVNKERRVRPSKRGLDVGRWIERKAIGSCDRVVTLTHRDADRWLGELDLEPERVIVIPDAIDVEEFSVPISGDVTQAFRRRFAIPEDRPVVAFIGRIRSEKGWQDLPFLLRELSSTGAHLLVCGDGPDRWKLEQVLRDCGGGTSWSVTGFLNPTDVKVALQIASVLILPSRREAFGGVLLEAMASGVPAVAYAVGGVVEVAGTPNAIVLAPPGDRSLFATAVVEILQCGRRRNLMIERGRRRVTEYRLRSAGRRTEHLYRELCRGGATIPGQDSLASQIGAS